MNNQVHHLTIMLQVDFYYVIQRNNEIIFNLLKKNKNNYLIICYTLFHSVLQEDNQNKLILLYPYLSFLNM